MKAGRVVPAQPGRLDSLCPSWLRRWVGSVRWRARLTPLRGAAARPLRSRRRSPDRVVRSSCLALHPDPPVPASSLPRAGGRSHLHVPACALSSLPVDRPGFTRAGPALLPVDPAVLARSCVSRRSGWIVSLERTMGGVGGLVLPVRAGVAFVLVCPGRLPRCIVPCRHGITLCELARCLDALIWSIARPAFVVPARQDDLACRGSPWQGRVWPNVGPGRA